MRTFSVIRPANLLVRASASLGCVALLCACAPQVEPFRFVELEQASGPRLEYSGPLEQPEIWFAGDIPLRYSLDRDRYRLLIINDAPSVLPGLTVALAPESEPGLKLVPAPAGQQSSPDGNVCASYYVLPAGVEMEFGWAADCTGEGYRRQIEFHIANAQGELIGREQLGFRLRRRGWYLLRDDL
jgi:hypothetical protein